MRSVAVALDDSSARIQINQTSFQSPHACASPERFLPTRSNAIGASLTVETRRTGAMRDARDVDASKTKKSKIILSRASPFFVPDSDGDDASDADGYDRGLITRSMLDAHRRRREERAGGRDATVDAAAAASVEETTDEDDDLALDRSIGGFEVSDGECSVHSDASHDRTAGVRGFSKVEVASEQFGRGKRKRDAAVNVVDVLARPVLVEHENESEDEGGSRERTILSEHLDAMVSAPRTTQHDEGEMDDVVLVPSTTMTRPMNRAQTFGKINANTMVERAVSRQATITSMFAKALAPWKFEHRVFGTQRPAVGARHAPTHVIEHDVEQQAMVEDTKREGVRVLEKAMRDFASRHSVGRVGVETKTSGEHRAAEKMSLDEIGDWRLSMALLERANGFWAVFGDCLRVFVDDEREERHHKLMLKSNEMLDDSSHAVCLEAGWELTFTVARIWYSEGYQFEHAVGTNWVSQAWAVIGWLLDETRLSGRPNEQQASPAATYSEEEYVRALTERIEELIAWWPRCTADRHPVRALWQRLHGADVNSGATKEWRLIVRNPAACCRVCAPLALRPYEETFQAADAPFVRGVSCESLYRALGDHLSKCAIERKVLHRELGRWLNDARLIKVIDDPAESSLGDDGFTALGGHSFPFSTASQRLQHRASVHVELFRACVRAGSDDQAILCLKQLLSSLATQKHASEDPAPRCVLLRAATTCLGIWLAWRATNGAQGQAQTKIFDEMIRVMRSLADCVKMTGSVVSSRAGTKGAMNDGAIIAEASVAWATAYAVLIVADQGQSATVLETLGDVEKRSMSEDWRERIFVSRSLATLCSPASFSDKCAPLSDLKPALCAWFALAVDIVSGGALPLAVALCARGELSIMNQEASSVTSVGWSQSNGGAAVATVLRGKKRRGDARVGVAGEQLGTLMTSQECDFRVAVAKLAAKEISKSFAKDASTMASIRRIAMGLPEHCVSIFRGCSFGKDKQDDESRRGPHVRAIGGIIQALVTHCAECLIVADARSLAHVSDVSALTLTLPRLIPLLPSSKASVWGAGDGLHISDALAVALEERATDIFRAELCAIDGALRTARRDADECLASVAERQLAVCTCGTLESIIGASNVIERERALITSLAKSLCGDDNSPLGLAGETVVRTYLPHFMLHAFGAPQKCAARRLITSTQLVSDLITPAKTKDDENVIAPSLVLGSVALPLVVLAHESIAESVDHHTKGCLAVVLSDVLCPLLSGFKESMDFHRHTRENTDKVLSAKHPQVITARSTIEQRGVAPAFPKPAAFPKLAAFPKPHRPTSTRDESSTQYRQILEMNTATVAPRAVENASEVALDDMIKAALNSSAVWRIFRAYVSASVSILSDAALATPISREISTRGSFHVISKVDEKTPRAREIERLREVLTKAKKLSSKALARERKEAERTLSDVLTPLSETVTTISQEGNVQWGQGTALAPNLFVVEENTSERARTLLVASVQFLTCCAKSPKVREIAQVSQHSIAIQAAATFLLEPDSRAPPSVVNAVKALTRVFGVERSQIPRHHFLRGG